MRDEQYSMTVVGLGADNFTGQHPFIPDNVFVKAARAGNVNSGTAVMPLSPDNPPVDMNKAGSIDEEMKLPVGLIATVAAVIGAAWLFGRRK